MARNVDLEKVLSEGKVLGAGLSHGKDMAGLPNITLNVKNLHLHFDERMDSRTYYGGQSEIDTDDCEGYDEEDCGDYDGYEEEYGTCGGSEDDGEADEDLFHKSFSFDEVVETVHEATGLCKNAISEIIEKHSQAAKPVSPEGSGRKGAGYGQR